MNEIVVVRGGGDIATGVIQKLVRAGFKVVVLETKKPTAIRRHVAVCEAIYDQVVTVEDITAKWVSQLSEINIAWSNNQVPVLIDEAGEIIKRLKPKVVVDAILAKRNYGTHKDMAPITIALGPGFNAGVDVDVVVETMRGHHLGRLIFEGYAQKNTGVPGEVGGYAQERVIYSTKSGQIHNVKQIGDVVERGETLTIIDQEPVEATISGVLRGIIRDGMEVKQGLKIADIDPRLKEINNCFTISDKARTIGGAVLEAIMYFKHLGR